MQAQACPPHRRSPRRIMSSASAPKGPSTSTARGPRQPSNPKRGGRGECTFCLSMSNSIFSHSFVKWTIVIPELLKAAHRVNCMYDSADPVYVEVIEGHLFMGLPLCLNGCTQAEN